MIAWLRGEVVRREGDLAVIATGGVGYAVHAPRRVLDGWSETNGPIEAHVSTQVREDAITLYGFATPTEQVAFERLLSVSGIGPRLALAALDTLTVSELAGAVASGDTQVLTRIPGVGKRTAQRMVLELESKLPEVIDIPGETVVPAAVPSGNANTLVLALGRLGYSRTEISRVEAALTREGIGREEPIEARLRAALRILYGR